MPKLEYCQICGKLKLEHKECCTKKEVAMQKFLPEEISDDITIHWAETAIELYPDCDDKSEYNRTRWQVILLSYFSPYICKGQGGIY